MDKEVNLKYSYLEFIEIAKSTEKHSNCKEFGSRESGKTFTATSSFDEAISLAENGWNAGIEKLGLTEGVLAGNGIEFNQNVYGSIVNVPNYLQGLPDSMWEMTSKQEYNRPTMTIYTALTYSANKTAKQALEYAKEVVKFVNIKQQTHNVRLVGLFAAQEGQGVREFTEVVIKGEDQRFVLNNIAFAFHPSFFRRLWFSHIEKKEYWRFGYGSPLIGSEISGWVEKNKVSGEETVFLPYFNDEGSFNNDKIIYY